MDKFIQNEFGFQEIKIIKENSIEPDTELAHHTKNELRNKNILISTDGPFDRVIKTKPALCFTKENAKEVVENIDKILETYYNNV